MAEALESNRFIPGKLIVRDLCLREKDFIQANRLWYMTFLRDAFIKLNFKTQMYTKRMALPVIRGTVPYLLTPPEYLDLSSISVEDECGILNPLIINPRIKTGIADLSLSKKCGCDCKCDHEVCSYIRNFETIYGTMEAKMPNNSMQSFTTMYRKVVLTDGSYVEEKTLPAEVFENNTHTDTRLETTRTFLCKLEIKKCGCLEQTEENLRLVNHHCKSVNYQFECGAPVTFPITNFDGTREHLQQRGREYNMDEVGDKIYLPSDFPADFAVIRFYVNSKSKNIMVPFLAKEAMMSSIKVLSTTFDKKEPMGVKQFWKTDLHQKLIDLNEDLKPVNISSFYAAQFGENKR